MGIQVGANISLSKEILTMSATPIPIVIRGLLPTTNGCALFLGNHDKTFVIYIDHQTGEIMRMALSGERKERPLTHDFANNILLGLDARITHIFISDYNEGTFFARVFLTMQNELGRKIIDIDARPSDSIIMAIKQKAPILVAKKVLDEVEDMTELFEQLRNNPPSEPSPEES